MAKKNDLMMSHIKSRFTDGGNDDEHYENLSTEELNLKINTFRNLCLANKVNVSNAFDVDMIGYFFSWLEKRKNTNVEDVISFQEMCDYLEASGKVYGYRVDNLSENTNKLVEEFRSLNYKNNVLKIDGENESLKIQKPKRPKLMLTTADKLMRKPLEMEELDPSIKQEIPVLNFHEMFQNGRPSTYMLSLYNNTSVREEIMKAAAAVEEKSDKKFIMPSLPDLRSIFSKRVICPGFNGFVAERDRIQESSDDAEDRLLEGIENRFDPNNHPFQNCFAQSLYDETNDTVEDLNEFDSNSNGKEKTLIDGLTECIDNVDRDYSFFNPKLLANWKGPKAWKAQEMVKALKSCNLSERKEIMSDSNIKMEHEDINELVQTKANKKRKKVVDNKVKINWLKMADIQKILDPTIEGKETLLPRTLEKWSPFDNTCDFRDTVVNIKYRFSFLEYLEIEADCMQRNMNYMKKENSKENLQETLPTNYQDIDDIEEGVVENGIHNDTDGDIDISCGKLETKNNPIEKSCNSDKSDETHKENDCVLNDFKTESRMDIGELKKEILEIIEQECVEIDPDNKWSSRLSFLNLLKKLRITEREGLSVAIVFVGLLHLANELGLQLFQEPSTINDMKEIYIAKPMNKG